jgi:predicted outer membrane repeat protein
MVHGNSVTGDGGGIDSPNGGAEMNLDNSKITGNHAGGDGGAIYMSGAAGQVTGTDIQGNSAVDGGGFNDATLAPLGFDNSKLSCNRATADGGFLYVEDPGTSVGFSDSTVSGNEAGAYGGGIYNQGSMGVESTRIVNDTAASGGGGIYDYGAIATVMLTSSTVRHNKPDKCEPTGSITGCTG